MRSRIEGGFQIASGLLAADNTTGTIPAMNGCVRDIERQRLGDPSGFAGERSRFRRWRLTPETAHQGACFRCALSLRNRDRSWSVKDARVAGGEVDDKRTGRCRRKVHSRSRLIDTVLCDRTESHSSAGLGEAGRRANSTHIGLYSQ